MSNVFKYFNEINMFFYRPQMLVGFIDAEKFYIYWEGFNIGWKTGSSFVNLYAYNFPIFYSWFIHKMKAMPDNNMGIIGILNKKAVEKKLSKEDIAWWFIDILKEYSVLKPVTVFRCKKTTEGGRFMLYKLASHLPWILLKMKNGYYDTNVLSIIDQKRNVSDLTFKKKYQLEMISWVKRELEMDFKTDFEPYDLEDFMEKYYYADLKKPSDEIEN